MSHKATSRKVVGPGYIMRLARQIHGPLRVSWDTAVARAKLLLGV